MNVFVGPCSLPISHETLQNYRRQAITHNKNRTDGGCDDETETFRWKVGWRSLLRRARSRNNLSLVEVFRYATFFLIPKRNLLKKTKINLLQICQNSNRVHEVFARVHGCWKSVSVQTTPRIPLFRYVGISCNVVAGQFKVKGQLFIGPL